MESANSNNDPRLAEALARIAELEASLRRIEAAQAGNAARSTVVEPAAPPVPAKARRGLDSRIWSIIAATVAAVCPEAHRIVGVQMQGPPLNLWAFEGRRAIFYSHQVRRA